MTKNNDLIKLQFYSKKRICSFMYNTRALRPDEMLEYTPTLLVAPSPKELAPSGKWNCGSSRMALCTACGSYYMVEGYIHDTPRAYCPSCGYAHHPKGILRVNSRDESIPCKSIDIILRECGEKISLIVRYESFIFGDEPVDHFAYHKNQETFCFYTTHKEKSYWENGDVRFPLGYYDDIEKIGKQSVLRFLNSLTPSATGEKFRSVLVLLRKVIWAKLKVQGLSKKSLTIKSRSTVHFVLDSVLNIAHQLRFWDSIPLPFYGTNENDKITNWVALLGVAPSDPHYEWQIENIMFVQKCSYQDAFLQSFKVPPRKLTRKYVNYHNVKQARYIYEHLDVKTADACLQILKGNFNFSRHLTDFLAEFKNMYPNMKLLDLINYCANRDSYDLLRTFRNLDCEQKKAIRNNPPKFKDLHDVVMEKYDEQGYRAFDISEIDLARLTKHIGDYDFKVVEDSLSCNEVGRKLRNCAGTYASRATMGDSLFLVSVELHEKVVALLEIVDNKLKQARLYANKMVRADNDINNAVVEYVGQCKLKLSTDNVNTTSTPALSTETIIA